MPAHGGNTGNGGAGVQQQKQVGALVGGAQRISELYPTTTVTGRDVPGAPGGRPGGHTTNAGGAK